MNERYEDSFRAWGLKMSGFVASLVAQKVKCLPTMWETRVLSLGRKIPWRRKWPPTPVRLPGESHRQRSLVVYSPWGRRESNTTEQLHFLLGFPGGTTGKDPACQCKRRRDAGLIPGLGRSPGLGRFPGRKLWQPPPVFFPGESPWTEEPGGLQSIGSHRVKHNWSDLARLQWFKDSTLGWPKLC